MASRTIFLHSEDLSAGPLSIATPTTSAAWPPSMLDTLHRPLRDLRISVTDRCNFRCSYCMPKSVFDTQYRYLPPSDLLTFEEITRLSRVFLSLGVQKLRLTGGEPLMRKNLAHLVEQLASLRTLDHSAPDLTLTTNAALLARQAGDLRRAGLQRLTISLDALDDGVFQRMNDVGFPVADVLKGIDAACAVGFDSIKVNMVVKRGVNEDQIVPMAHYFLGRGIALRFIEYMDVGSTNGWRMEDVVPSATVLAQLQEHFTLTPLPCTAPGETAQRWAYTDRRYASDASTPQGEIGFISSVSQAFCRDCNRARLSTNGQLFLCLFASRGWDLRTLLRSPSTDGLGVTDAQLQQTIANIWQHRDDQYSALRGIANAKSSSAQRVEMSYIGG